MARLGIVLLLLLILAPASMAEPSRHALADHDWIGGLWHRLMSWISGVGAYLIPDGLQEPDTRGDTACISACVIPDGLQAEPNGVGAYLIPDGLQAENGS